MDNIVVQLIDKSTEFQPGPYSYPFQFDIPGDLVTIDSTRLEDKGTYWRYSLIANAQPSSRLTRKMMEVKKDLLLRRVHVPPPSISLLSSLTDNLIQYVVGRKGDIKCSVLAPKVVAMDDLQAKVILEVKMNLHPATDSHQVAEVQVKAVQKEQIRAHRNTFISGKSRLFKELSAEEEMKWKGDEMFGGGAFMDVMCNVSALKDISKEVVLKNPFEGDGENSSAINWGRDLALDIEIELDTQAMIPSECLNWIQLTHLFTFQIVFKDKALKPVTANVPFRYLKFVEQDLDNTLADPEP